MFSTRPSLALFFGGVGVLLLFVVQFSANEGQLKSSPPGDRLAPLPTPRGQVDEEQTAERSLAPGNEVEPPDDAQQEAESYLRRLETLARTNKRAALDEAQAPIDGFPQRGVYAEAREAFAITLLVDLERMQEARAEVRRFIQTHPQSRYRRLVQGVTGIHPRPSGPSQP